MGKKCAKEGAKMIFNSSNFLKKSDQQKSKIFSSKAVFFFDTPTPPHPSNPFWQAIVRAGFFGMKWDCHAVDINVGQRRSVASDRAFFSWPMVISNSVNEFFVAV